MLNNFIFGLICYHKVIQSSKKCWLKITPITLSKSVYLICAMEIISVTSRVDLKVKIEMNAWWTVRSSTKTQGYYGLLPCGVKRRDRGLLCLSLEGNYLAAILLLRFLSNLAAFTGLFFQWLPFHWGWWIGGAQEASMCFSVVHGQLVAPRLILGYPGGHFKC